MNNKERRDKIVGIIRKQGYTTAKYLTEILDYSTATINRDLNALQTQGVVIRSYGGVELKNHGSIPLMFRYNKAKLEKRLIAKRASELVMDGDIIFIDGSTTTEYMMYYLTEKKRITVISNNIAVIAYLSQYDIRCICLGGEVSEAPYILDGVDTVESAQRYMADKMFFSVGSLDSLGNIYTTYNLTLSTMMRNSKEKFLLIDHEKIGKAGKRSICSLDSIDSVISDGEFSENIKKTFPKTKFVEVKK